MRRHIVLGDRVNATVVVLPEGVLIIDTSVDTPGAQEVLAESKKHGQALYVINTHEHHDHLAGNSLFTCPIISSAAARAEMQKDNVPALPSLVFSQEMELFLSEPVLLKHFGGHSPGSSVVYFPERRLLFTGDLIFAGRVPYMGEAQFRSWLAALTELEGWEVDMVVPGHGPQGGKELLTQQRQWLGQYIQNVLDWTAQGMCQGEMLSQVLERYEVVERWHPMITRSIELIQAEYK